MSTKNRYRSLSLFEAIVLSAIAIFAGQFVSSVNADEPTSPAPAPHSYWINGEYKTEMVLVTPSGSEERDVRVGTDKSGNPIMQHVSIFIPARYEARDILLKPGKWVVQMDYHTPRVAEGSSDPYGTYVPKPWIEPTNDNPQQQVAYTSQPTQVVVVQQIPQQSYYSNPAYYNSYAGPVFQTGFGTGYAQQTIYSSSDRWSETNVEAGAVAVFQINRRPIYSQYNLREPGSRRR